MRGTTRPDLQRGACEPNPIDSIPVRLGSAVGEATFGYRSEPVGEMRINRRGRPGPEGYRMRPYPPESEVVRDVFGAFANGTSIKAIVADLNRRQVPGRHGVGMRWSPSTVSRILKNEQYVGRWLWKRTETRRDPLSGRKRRIAKPQAEWHLTHNEDLRIERAASSTSPSAELRTFIGS